MVSKGCMIEFIRQMNFSYVFRVSFACIFSWMIENYGSIGRKKEIC